MGGGLYLPALHTIGSEYGRGHSGTEYGMGGTLRYGGRGQYGTEYGTGDEGRGSVW